MNLVAQVITPSDYRVMTWRNGNGATTQVAIEPPGADIAKDPFIWRMSLAQVEQSCPFSSFRGFDRILMVLEGHGLRLTDRSTQHAGPPAKIKDLPPMVPYTFRGEDEIYAELKAGPVKDFNVMVQREKARAEVTLLSIPKGDVRLPVSLDVMLVHLLEGSARASLVHGQTEARYNIPEGHTFRLDKHPGRESGAGTTLSFSSSTGARAIVTQLFYLTQ